MSSRRANIRWKALCVGALILAGPALWPADSPVTRAEAHELWHNGSPIPDWVKKQCCGEADAHHLQPSQVHVTAYGYEVDGYTGVIPERRRLQSPDGEWWVFYRILDSGAQSQVYCFFGPAEAS